MISCVTVNSQNNFSSKNEQESNSKGCSSDCSKNEVVECGFFFDKFTVFGT